MKIARFGPDARLAVLDGDRLVDLDEASRLVSGSPSDTEPAGGATSPTELHALITGGPAMLERAARALESSRDVAPGELGPGGQAIVHRLDEVRVRAPWPGRRIACAGGNYADHVAGMLGNLDDGADAQETARRQIREQGQWGFWKVTHEVAGPGDAIPVPRRADGWFDYEAEVAVVIGAQAKDLDPEQAESIIWGFTLLNDWSIRPRESAPWPMSYNLPKNFDGCVSIGPVIVAGEGRADDIDVLLTVNGEARQSFNSRDMIFSFYEIIAELSRDFTLLPGDVISGGTGAGTAADSSPAGPDGSQSQERFLHAGDVVELSSPQIGSMANTIVTS